MSLLNLLFFPFCGPTPVESNPDSFGNLQVLSCNSLITFGQRLELSGKLLWMQNSLKVVVCWCRQNFVSSANDAIISCE